MAVKTYRKTALVTAEQFLPAIGQIPAGVYSTALGHPSKRPDAEWVLDTKEARHTLRVGDYICTGSKGERWNVEREIFEETYEEVSTPTPAPNMVGDNQPRYTTKRLHDEIDKARAYGLEMAAQLIDDTPRVGAPHYDELARRIRVLAVSEGSSDE